MAPASVSTAVTCPRSVSKPVTRTPPKNAAPRRWALRAIASAGRVALVCTSEGT